MDNLSIFCIVLMIGWLVTAVILMRALGNSYTKDNLLKIRKDAIDELSKIISKYQSKEMALFKKHSYTARNQTRDAKGRFVSSRTKDKIDLRDGWRDALSEAELEADKIHNLYASLSESSDHIGPYLAPNVEEFYDICILDKDDDFILPERWAVRITEENREALRTWVISQPDFDKIFDTPSCFIIGYFVVSKHPRFYSHQLMCSELLFGFTEITFDQFQKYVLNK